MKQKYISVFVIFTLLSSIMLGITISSATNLTLFNENSIDFGESPALVQLYADYNKGNLVDDPADGTRPYWVDLVDREFVQADGSGVYVAVLDTGLMPDWPFFLSEANIASELGIGFTHEISSYDVDTGLLEVGPLEVVGFETEWASGHGTHVTSTITGFNLNGEWIEGIAPEVTIIPVRVLDGWVVPGTDGGLYGFTGGFNDMIAAGIYYVADLSDSLDGPVIINMSLGGPSPSSMIEAAINYAISKGVIIIASAGNNGEAGMGYPGAFDQVISVGAVGWTDMFSQPDFWRADVPERLFKDDSLGNDYQVYLEDFSSRPNLAIGQSSDLLDFSAPGAWIVGPYQPAFSWSPSYYYLSGTSMASPHAAGIAALILDDYPHFDQEDIENILILASSGKFFNRIRGFPSSGTDVVVAFPFNADGFYTLSWDEDDFGAGFLKADTAVFTAFLYNIFNKHR